MIGDKGNGIPYLTVRDKRDNGRVLYMATVHHHHLEDLLSSHVSSARDSIALFIRSCTIRYTFKP